MGALHVHKKYLFGGEKCTVQCKLKPIYTGPYTFEGKKGTKNVNGFPTSSAWSPPDRRGEIPRSVCPRKSKSVTTYSDSGKNSAQFARKKENRLPTTRLQRAGEFWAFLTLFPPGITPFGLNLHFSGRFSPEIRPHFRPQYFPDLPGLV